MDDQLTFRIPRELARALARRARDRGVPKSHVVREALADYLAAEPARGTAGAVWERVKSFGGSLPLDHAGVESDEIARRIRRHNWRE